MDTFSPHKIPPGNAGNSLDFNISDDFLLKEVVLSTEDKLSWLSSLRRALERPSEGSEKSTPVNRLVGRLRDLLTPAEDLFVVYEAQKVFVALVKIQNNEEGICLIQTVLETSACLETVTCYLEICRDLLSKQNAHCCVFLARIRSSVGHVVQLYRNGCYRNITDNFLYQLITVIFKIVKLASLYKSEANFRALREIYLCNCSVFLVLLFQEDVKGFVRRKLCLTMYHLLRPSSALFVSYKELDNIPGIHPLRNNLKEFADSFCKRVLSIGFVKVIWRHEQTDGFTGCTSCVKGDSDIDYAHLREWSVLSLGMARLLLKASKEDSKANIDQCLDFVEKLDSCVRDGLGLLSSIPYDWLPRVFADQDDMWIDALLMLMDLQTRLALDHHWYFLQLVSAVAYDHLVILDLLTSPETCFLDYLTRYLKYLLNTWTGFTHTVARFGTDNTGDTGDIDDTGDKDDTGDTGDIDERDIPWTHTMCSRNSLNCDNKELSYRNSVNIETKHLSFSKESDYDSIGELFNKRAYPTQDTKNIANDLLLDSSLSLEPIGVKTEQSFYEDGEDCKVIAAYKYNTGQSVGAIVQRSAGLAMIMGTYSDSEEEMEHESSAADISLAQCNKGVSGYECHRQLQSSCTEPAICKSEKDKSMNAKFEAQNASVSNTPAASISDHSDIAPEINDGEEDIPDTSDFSTDTCKDNHDFDHGEGVLGDDSCAMDRTMGMLIRVNLKLQRLWRHQIISYDPQALLKLLDSVESWYDQTGK